MALMPRNLARTSVRPQGASSARLTRSAGRSWLRRGGIRAGIIGLAGLTGLALTGCSPQRSAEASAAGPLADGPVPLQGLLSKSELCIDNYSSMSVQITWKNAEGSDGDCGWGGSHTDKWSDDVIASIVVDGRETILAGADNEAFQRPSVAIEDATYGARRCFGFRGYLDRGKNFSFPQGQRLDDGIAAYEMYREGMEASMKEMRVAIYDSADPVSDVRLRHCS